MRFKRHGVIAKLVKAINNHDKENAIAAPKFLRKRSPPEQDEADGGGVVGESTSVSPDMSIASSNDYGFKPESLSKKLQKAQRKTEKMARQVRADPESVTREDLDHVSEAIYLKIQSSKTASLADINFKENTDGADPALPYGEGIDPQLVAENLYFSSTQRNKYYGRMARCVSSEVTPSQFPNTPSPNPSRTPKIKFDPRTLSKPSSPSVVEDLLTSIDPKIFERLGVPMTLTYDSSKKRRDLIKKLATLIQEDVGIIRKEDEDTRMRQAGFWRFVSSATLENLIELHKGFCWATGELKNKEKYGESVKVASQEERLETAGRRGIKQFGVGKAEQLDFSTFGVKDTRGMTKAINAVTPDMKAKGHKRLSSQEGFTIPKSQTSSRLKLYSECLGSRTVPPNAGARNVLRILSPNIKEPEQAGGPFRPVAARNLAPLVSQTTMRKASYSTSSENHPGGKNFYADLEEREA